MYSNDLLFGLLAFACAVVISRLLAEKALKRLSTEEKAKLLDSFSGHRIFSVVSMLIVVLAFFAASRAWPESSQSLVWGLLILMVVMSIGNGLFSYAKLRKLSAPKDYVANFLIRCVVYYCGLVILLYVLATRYLLV